MLTSHLRATHDAAVKECVNSKFLDVVEMLSDGEDGPRWLLSA